jgi:hypothetical protein
MAVKVGGAGALGLLATAGMVMGGTMGGTAMVGTDMGIDTAASPSDWAGGRIGVTPTDTLLILTIRTAIRIMAVALPTMKVTRRLMLRGVVISSTTMPVMSIKNRGTTKENRPELALG